MTITSLTGPGRVVQFLWGPNQQNTLTFGYPLALDNPRFWRAPRMGSEQIIVNDRAESWTLARDYYATFLIRWVPLQQWAGGAGVQAFLDWATGASPFTFVPDAVNAPFFSLPGCILTNPFDSIDPQPEADGSQSIEITFRNPTYDLGLAWRGLFFEYVTGADITQPVVATVTRAGAVGPFVGRNGLAGNATANVLRDRHYPLYPTLTKTTLLEPADTNLIENGDYEVDAVGSAIQAGTSVARSTAQAFNGTASLLVTCTNNGDSGVFITKRDGTRTAAAAGTTYTLSAWVYAPSTSVGKLLYPMLQWFTAASGGTQVGANVAGSAVALVAGWQRLSVTALAPATTNAANLFVLTSGAQGAIQFYVDVPQFEASLFATSAIPTGTGAVTRNADSFSYLWAIPPSQMATAWVYVKFIEQGTALGANNERVFVIAPTGGWVAPGLVCNINSGAQQYGFQNHDGAVNPASVAAVTPTIGQTVEILCLVNGGTPLIRVSVNGGPDVVGNTPANAPLAASFNTQGYLQIGRDPGAGQAIGTMGLSLLRVGFSAGVNTLAAARTA